MKQTELRKYIKNNDVVCDRCNKNKAVVVVNKKCICEECYRKHSRTKNCMIINYIIGIFISSIVCNALDPNPQNSQNKQVRRIKKDSSREKALIQVRAKAK